MEWEEQPYSGVHIEWTIVTSKMGNAGLNDTSKSFIVLDDTLLTSGLRVGYKDEDKMLLGGG